MPDKRKMPEIVQLIERQSPICSLAVYNRAGEVLYLNNAATASGLKWVPEGKDAKMEIVAERERDFSQEERESFELLTARVMHNMKMRGASKREINTACELLTGKKRR